MALVYKCLGDNSPHEHTVRTEKEQDLRDNPLLIYCNWSFAKEYHIFSKELKYAIENFDLKYSPFYIRMINEIPPRIIKMFVERHNIDYVHIEHMYNEIDIVKKYLNHNFLKDFKNAKV